MNASESSRGRRMFGVAFLAGLAIVPIAAYFLVFAPRNEEIAGARREITVKQARLAGLRELTARIGDLGREIESRRSELAQLDERLPASEGLDGLLKEITRIAQRADLSVRTVKGEKPVAAGPAMEVPLTLALEGDFAGLYDFLIAVESLPRITRIEGLKVTALAGDARAKDRLEREGDGLVRAELTLAVYFSAQKVAATAGPQEESSR